MKIKSNYSILLKAKFLIIVSLLIVQFLGFSTKAFSQQFGSKSSMTISDAIELTITQPNPKIYVRVYKDDGYDEETQKGILRIQNNSGQMAKVTFDLVAILKCGKEKSVHWSPFLDKNAAYINVTSSIAVHSSDCSGSYIIRGKGLDVIQGIYLKNFTVKFYTDCEWDEYKYGIKCNGN